MNGYDNQPALVTTRFFQPPQVHGIECPERQHHPLHRSESRARWTPRAESSEVQV